MCDRWNEQGADGFDAVTERRRATSPRALLIVPARSPSKTFHHFIMEILGRNLNLGCSPFTAAGGEGRTSPTKAPLARLVLLPVLRLGLAGLGLNSSGQIAEIGNSASIGGQRRGRALLTNARSNRWGLGWNGGESVWFGAIDLHFFPSSASVVSLSPNGQSRKLWSGPGYMVSPTRNDDVGHPVCKLP